MDLGRLRTGERLAGGAGIGLLVAMWFFNWYQVGTTSYDAWGSFSLIDWILFLTAIAAIGLAILRGTQRSLDLPMAPSVIVTALGVLSALLVLYRLIDLPEVGATTVEIPGLGSVSSGVDESREAGAFLGLIAVAGIALGGYMSMQDEGTSFSEARQQLADPASSGSRGPNDPAAGPPRPPTRR